MFKKVVLFLSIVISFTACVGVYVPSLNAGSSSSRPNQSVVQTIVAPNFPEGFEGDSKSRYEGSNITVLSGQWYLDNAVIGGADNDQKNGIKAVRMKEKAKLTMNFDCPNGIQQVRFKYGVYQLDKASTFELWASTNAGNSWQQIGTTLSASEKALRDALFNVDISQAARIEIRKTDGSANRLNIDDVIIITYETTTNATPIENNSTVASRDDNFGLGNPSNATDNTFSSDNFLMIKTAYTLSYNNNKGTANWVSWHLSTAWKGETARQNDFRPDLYLPNNWSKVNPRDYTDTGFDRGHLCPSDDRDGGLEDNQETFFMTNMTPQAPDHNRGIWKTLEDYGRILTQQGNEVYIIAGTHGQGGEGKKGFANTIGRNNNIMVPASLWKIIVVLPIGQNDVQRINENTRIIAVNIPNQNSVGADNWRKYQVSVDELEALTGFDFLSNVPIDIQAIIESRVDR